MFIAITSFDRLVEQTICEPHVDYETPATAKLLLDIETLLIERKTLHHCLMANGTVIEILQYKSLDAFLARGEVADELKRRCSQMREKK